MVGPKTSGFILFIRTHKRVKKLYRENNIKKYHLNDLIFYIKPKDFEIVKSQDFITWYKNYIGSDKKV